MLTLNLKHCCRLTELLTWGPSLSPGSPPVWPEVLPAPPGSPALTWSVSDAEWRDTTKQRIDSMQHFHFASTLDTFSHLCAYSYGWACSTVHIFTSHPDFSSGSLSCIYLLFEVADLLSQDFSVLQQVVEVAPGLLCADHHLHFIEKPRLITGIQCYCLVSWHYMDNNTGVIFVQERCTTST